jgi:hypothetical protein
MHDLLRERIIRNLEALPDERLYQVLDYIEFLGSKYARSAVRPAASPFQRFGERLEDKLRGNSVGFGAIRSTMEAMGTADRVVSGLAEAGRSLLREVSGTSGGEPTPPPSTERRIPPAPRDGFPVDG